MLTAYDRAYTTSKADAFAVPLGLLDRSYAAGKNAINPWEEALAREYETKHNRPDLAGYVRNGRKYHRLMDSMFGGSLKSLNATRRAFTGMSDDAEGQPETFEEWAACMLEKFKDHEGLQAVRRLPLVRQISVWA
jgi:hypothetical protein